MGNGEQSGSGRSDWRVRLSGAAGGVIAGAVALFVVRPLVELPLWLGPIAFGIMIALGIILGRFVGGLLVQASSAVPPDGDKGAS